MPDYTTMSRWVRFDDWRDRLAQVLAYRDGDKALGDDLVEWAQLALEAGQDSRSLRMLAGLDTPAHSHEATELFKAAAQELDLEVSGSDEEHMWAYLDLIARRVVASELDADTGLAEMYTFFNATYDGRLKQFVYLSDDCERVDQGEPRLFFPDLTSSSRHETIRQVMHAYLREREGAQ